MSGTGLDVALVLVFIVIGGLFAGSEIALVSLRDSQIRQLAQRGKRGQLVAKLTSSPNRFLSAVQVGVTVSGFLAAAFGADQLAGALSPSLVGLGLRGERLGRVDLVLHRLVGGDDGCAEPFRCQRLSQCLLHRAARRGRQRARERLALRANTLADCGLVKNGGR